MVLNDLHARLGVKKHLQTQDVTRPGQAEPVLLRADEPGELTPLRLLGGEPFQG